MRRLPKRKGVSFGTIAMLTVAGLVILGYTFLFPKFFGQTDIHFNARELAVAFDRSFGESATHSETSSAISALSASSEPFEWIPTTEPDIPAPAPVAFRLTAAGCVHVDNNVQKAMATDDGYRFADLFSLLSGDVVADIAIVTLEHTVVSAEKTTDINAPTDILAALGACGFRAICLGHNNIFHSGLAGAVATREAVQAAGLLAYGVYGSRMQRDALMFMEVNGLSVALLSYQEEIGVSVRKKLSEEELGFAYGELSLPVIESDIKRADALGAQVVIVSLCWGKVGAEKPTPEQRDLAQAIADAGADIILGTHSGVLQPVEILTADRGGVLSQTLCAYSLGNLFSNDRKTRATISGILLHANAIYNPATDTISFNQLSYTPTYVWRGKKEDRTAYAALPSDVTAPGYVQGDQLDVMQRSLTLVQGVMRDSPLSIRKPGSVFLVIEQ